MSHASPSSLAFLSAEIPAISGRARIEAEDFEVHEMPAYLPEGEGEHLFVHFEKKELSTPQAVRSIALALGCDPKDSGYAGLKDKHAITSQWASFFCPQEVSVDGLELENIRVLQSARHSHKLRTGHLRSNHFRLRIRDAGPFLEQSKALLKLLSEQGVPNYFGEQRFGLRNLETAKAWLIEGGKAPRKAFERKLYVSVLQSAVFNSVLNERICNKELSKALPGDIYRKEDTGGMFDTENLADAQRRLESFEISPTGPMPGIKMRAATKKCSRGKALRWINGGSMKLYFETLRSLVKVLADHCASA
ncbi:MAG: tRNA pseudouridine(13) synthase TruD [Myxococcales bacterium]|nr:MAG: tRNA pseudouridine(13) synthase TruD [Myxococcales bacterium]